MLIVMAALLALASALPLLFRHHARRAGRRRSPPRRVRATSLGSRRPSSTRSHSGEIVSRLAADTTQIKSAVGATASLALRNVDPRTRRGRHDGGHQPEALRPGRSPPFRSIVLPLVAFGRSVRRRVARWRRTRWPHATAYASEQIGAVRTLQAFTNEPLVTGRFRGGRRGRLRGGAVVDLGARAAHLLRHLHDLSSRRRRCCGSARATCSRARCRRARSASSCSMRCSPPARSARCRRSGASCRQAAGAAERLAELLAETADDRRAGRAEAAAAPTRKGAIDVRATCRSPIRRAPTARRSTALLLRCSPARRWPSSARPAPARARSSR